MIKSIILLQNNELFIFEDIISLFGSDGFGELKSSYLLHIFFLSSTLYNSSAANSAPKSPFIICGHLNNFYDLELS